MPLDYPGCAAHEPRAHAREQLRRPATQFFLIPAEADSWLSLFVVYSAGRVRGGRARHDSLSEYARIQLGEKCAMQAANHLGHGILFDHERQIDLRSSLGNHANLDLRN